MYLHSIVSNVWFTWEVRFLDEDSYSENFSSFTQLFKKLLKVKKK
jgi:hypothetical protein